MWIGDSDSDLICCAQRLVELLAVTLATAEFCTAGMLATTLTRKQCDGAA